MALPTHLLLVILLSGHAVATRILSTERYLVKLMPMEGMGDMGASGVFALKVLKMQDTLRLVYVFKAFNLKGPMPPLDAHLMKVPLMSGPDIYFFPGKWQKKSANQWNLGGSVTTNKTDTKALEQAFKKCTDYFLMVETKAYPDGAVQGFLWRAP